uniref:Uncharacterized protein n=1 Tax=Erpetoichthys calabaricus TaxID=27687 RepID=A0A8C4XDL6_ERPCA
MLLKKYFLYILFKGNHMDVALYQFHGFSVGFCFPLCWEAMWSVKLKNIAFGASVVANNLLYEVREEVEILSEQIKDLNLASLEQLESSRCPHVPGGAASSLRNTGFSHHWWLYLVVGRTTSLCKN